MLVLDTNVISELMRPSPADGVYNWVQAQFADELFTTTITQAEILFGIALMSEGHRRTILSDRAERMFAEDFVERVLAFDSSAAAYHATLAADRQRSGRPISEFDAAIAAIALSTGAMLVTRNIKDFAGIGLELLNPWNA